MPILAAVLEGLNLVVKYWGPITTLIEALEGKKMSEAQATDAIKAGMTAAADAQMRIEFGQ